MVQVSLYPRRGIRLKVFPAQRTNDTDFVVWVLRVALEVGIGICTHLWGPPLLLPSSVQSGPFHSSKPTQ